MYKQNKYKFNSQVEFVDFLSSQLICKNQPVAVVAGHFMLMYDAELDKLVPMIWQDASSPRVITHSKNMAGNFPVQTFGCGLEIIKKCSEIDVNAKVVFLVNDHKFQSISFQPVENSQIKGRAGELRRAFYFNNSSLPDSYTQILIEKDMHPTTAILNNDLINREKTSVLPPQTPYFSEQVLRNKCEKDTKYKLVRDHRFSLQSSTEGSRTLFYQPDEFSNKICLTEGGECGCCGEAIQLFLDLVSKGISNIIIFSPDECLYPVKVAAEAAYYLINKYEKKKIRIFVVSNMGGMGQFMENGLARTIHLSKYSDDLNDRKFSHE